MWFLTFKIGLVAIIVFCFALRTISAFVFFQKKKFWQIKCDSSNSDDADILFRGSSIFGKAGGVFFRKE